jgi:hypothetical protein
MSRRIKQWQAELRKIKNEAPAELRPFIRRISRNKRDHRTVNPDYVAVREIRTNLMREELK